VADPRNIVRSLDVDRRLGAGLEPQKDTILNMFEYYNVLIDEYL